MDGPPLIQERLRLPRARGKGKHGALFTNQNSQAAATEPPPAAASFWAWLLCAHQGAPLKPALPSHQRPSPVGPTADLGSLRQVCFSAQQPTVPAAQCGRARPPSPQKPAAQSSPARSRRLSTVCLRPPLQKKKHLACGTIIHSFIHWPGRHGAPVCRARAGHSGCRQDGRRGLGGLGKQGGDHSVGPPGPHPAGSTEQA